MEYFGRTNQKLRERRLIKWISPKMSKLPKSIGKTVICMLYLNCCLLRIWCLVITEEKSKSFWSNLRLILVTRHYGGVNSSKGCQVCHIKLYCNNYLRQHWQTSHFFKKTCKTWWSYHHHGKHGNHTMIMPWIMTTMPRNMAAVLSSWHDHDHVSPWSWWDQGKIMSWHPCFSKPGIELVSFTYYNQT